MKTNWTRSTLTRCALLMACGLTAAPSAGADRLVFGAVADPSGGTDPNYPNSQVALYGNDPLTGVFNFQLIDAFENEEFTRTYDLHVASGDINGDGTPDIITAPGAGSRGIGLPGPRVHVYDGYTGRHLPGKSFHPLGPSFTGGLTVASGDFNNDGIDDIVTGADLGGSPHVRVFSGDDQTVFGTFSNFNSVGFVGGVNVSAADYSGDGIPDIIASSGGKVALLETGSNASGEPTWNTVTPPTFSPFGEGYTGFIDTTLLNVPTTPGGATRPVLIASGPNGLLAFDITDPTNTASIFTNFLPGDLTGAGVVAGDYDGDGQDDIALYRDDITTWFITGPSANSFLTFTPAGNFVPFGGSIGGAVANVGESDVFSRASTVTPDQISTGAGDTNPGASKQVDLFGDINVMIYATDQTAVGKDFEIYSLNLGAADKVNLPDGVQLLPRTRAMFAETDAPDGTYEAELEWIFTTDELEAILRERGIDRGDIRFARITALGATELEFFLTVIDTPAEVDFREYENSLGESFTAITDTNAFASFSGYTLVVVPEPSSLALFGLGGWVLARRRR